ncbi:MULTISPECIES: carboxylesterase family protein [unclassified Streptomyces]|uniref:carboxylesterase/lipase family protein n=1 Tax=unclassified Streptomyces TaxID=2593676 RepID=UPI002E0D286C|nr:carboxylesterase family protein [Streptomyces sp. NBC_01205]
MSRARFARRLSAVCCALLLLATAAGPVSAAAGARAGDRPVVDTDRGPVRGTAHGTYRTFEGIPYAAPPTGPLRWRLPQPAARWTGVRDAGAPGARCMQLPPIGPGGPGGSEDCLYLNVTAPTGPTAATDAGRGGQRRPVMVWFHGGGFANGAGDLYRPQRLAVQGDAVVVTVNYRLGIFGLFGHPALGGAPDFAIADQQAALRWVRSNAARFGGNPSDVTLFGESAGGLSVCAHLTSPASGGLFQRALLQSGSCSTTMPPRSLLPTLGRYEPFVPEQRTVADGVATATGLGCDRPEPSAVLDCLRGKDAATLTTPELMQRFSLVSYGNHLLPEEPRAALEGGRFHRVPVIEGVNRDEMRIFLAQGLAAFPIPDGAAYRARVEQSFGAAAVPAVTSRYSVAAYPTPALAWAAVLSDASFICPALRDGRALARHVPVHAYRFSDRDAPNFTGLPEVEGLPYGASHGFELPYLFTMDAALTGPQRALSERMTGYWTAFARTGRPPAAWPPLGSAGSVLSFAPGSDGTRVVDGAAEHHCAFWDAQWP